MGLNSFFGRVRICLWRKGADADIASPYRQYVRDIRCLPY
jgi:hypothetical protein